MRNIYLLGVFLIVLFFSLSCKEKIQLPADKVSLVEYTFHNPPINDSYDTIFYGLAILGISEIDKNFNIKLVRSSTSSMDYLTTTIDLSDDAKNKIGGIVSNYLNEPPMGVSPEVDRTFPSNGVFMYLLVEKEGKEPVFISFIQERRSDDLAYIYDQISNEQLMFVKGTPLSVPDSAITAIKEEVFSTLAIYDKYMVIPPSLYPSVLLEE